MNEAALIIWLKSIKVMLNQKGVLRDETLRLTPDGWLFSFQLYPPNPFNYAMPNSWHFVGASSVELMETVNRWVAEYEPPEPVKEEAVLANTWLDTAWAQIEKMEAAKSRPFFRL